MGKNAFALGADFLCPDRMGNLGAEHLDFAAIGLPQQGGNLLGEVGAVVHHRQQYAVDLELGVDLPLHLIYGLEQLFQALGGQILRLNGDYDPVGGGQGVDREHTQGWLTVNQDSILRGYPINSFMLWKISDSEIKSGYKFYEFITSYREFFAENNKDIDTKGVPDFEAVIDGQQRLTSLYIGLRGTYAYKMPRKWWKDTEECIPTRRLYLRGCPKLCVNLLCGVE